MGTPAKLLLSSQKCQGVPFYNFCLFVLSQSVNKHYSCSGPVGVDPQLSAAKRRVAIQDSRLDCSRLEELLGGAEAGTLGASPGLPESLEAGPGRPRSLSTTTVFPPPGFSRAGLSSRFSRRPPKSHDGPCEQPVQTAFNPVQTLRPRPLGECIR